MRWSRVLHECVPARKKVKRALTSREPGPDSTVLLVPKKKADAPLSGLFFLKDSGAKNTDREMAECRRFSTTSQWHTPRQGVCRGGCGRRFTLRCAGMDNSAAQERLASVHSIQLRSSGICVPSFSFPFRHPHRRIGYWTTSVCTGNCCVVSSHLTFSIMLL